MDFSAHDRYVLLKKLSYQSLLELATPEGINASGKDEIYGCIFGRDSAITILKILKALSNPSDKHGVDQPLLLSICRRSLLHLATLQGKTTTIESGEEPGKFIHEFRKERYDHLTSQKTPWYIYPDGILRNYDSIDATPLALIAIHRYWHLTNDVDFLVTILPAVKNGLEWIMNYGDSDHDFLLEYQLHADRTHGGLQVQSWTDSHESVRQKNGDFPRYPIAPVEVQGYAWLALRLWGNYYSKPTRQTGLESKAFGHKLKNFAKEMKKSFNNAFIFKENGIHFAAQALDGNKKQIRTITGNPLLLLWATFLYGKVRTSILDKKYVYEVVKRGFMADMFDTDAGIRTMSSLSETFDSSTNSYHNGSFWPKLNGMVHEGLVNWGYFDEAEQLKQATLKPLLHFGTPIELYIKTDTGYSEWINAQTGQTSCRVQAWSAAAALDLLTQ